MIAALLKSVNEIEVEDFALQSLKDNELLIKVECCGICGTDHRIYEGKAPSSIPVILGHEFSGTVADSNGFEPKFRVGDKVVIDPNISCGFCDYCRKGKINLCENHKALGVTLNGGFAEYSIVPALQLYNLPADFDLSIAAFAEPVSCRLQGIAKAKISLGDSVIVVGGGTIGLIMVQLARIAGAAKIILIEPVTSKQIIGLELGADFVLSPDDENLVENVKNIFGGSPSIIIECVGNKLSVELSVKLSSKGTHLVIFGMAPFDHNIEMNLQYLFQNEISISNSFLNPYTFKPAVDLLVNKRINVKDLISQQVSLNNINNIFSHKHGSQLIKQQII